MLRRTALVLLLFLFTAAAGLFAVDRLDVDLPWSIAALTGPDTTKKDGTTGNGDTPASPEPEASTSDDAGQDASKTAEKAENAIEDTVAALSNDAPAADEPEAGSVALDISRISPDGPSVFAGRAEPGTYVTLMENGKPAGTTKADSSGSWSLSTEHKFASADPEISFEVAEAPPPKAEPVTEEAEVPEEAQAAEASSEQRPAAAAADPNSAPAVAGDVMRKFENIVSEAREEAAAEERRKFEEQRLARLEDAKRKDAERRAAATEKAAAQKESESDAPAAGEAAPEETTVAAAKTDTPAGPEAQTQSADEESASESRAAASASADKTPGAKSTLEGSGSESGSDSKTAMMAAPGKAAKPTAQAPIPVPLMFVYNQATLTPEGERASALLLEYLLLKRLSSVELTGHADERGTYAYNYDLSRERLEAVAEILKEGGYKGDLKLTPKGKTEPFRGIDRSKYRGEALYQFDRRVELRVTR